ncbi:hypothetical protein MJO28_016188 [Puccinia striiformis f. sp. tritici]|uniref:Uncharacterized protein n=1 Tax=Puccinia striiformis f. sp. tritici TaxID=168172 RepID=A0ACC0DMJ9_9BASI|nr:hypothetical protein MJO28_016188 [Puccinia striiformis f. sp. tritici]
MSETESEQETQLGESEANFDPGIGLRNGLYPNQLDEHLLRKEEPNQADTIQSAVEILSQTIQESDLVSLSVMTPSNLTCAERSSTRQEGDEGLNIGLARAAQTISSFLKLAKLSISTEGDYNILPGWMRRELVDGLDMILSERFINALFLLRQQIRHLAIKREGIVSSQMVTLSDVIIAAIIDYVSCSDSNEEHNQKEGAEYQTIELAVRLPQRLESLGNCLTSHILGIEPELNLQIKLAALAILYCSKCLKPTTQSSEKNLADCLSSFGLCAQLEKVSDMAIAHLLCVYVCSCVDFTDELHPFRPATNSALWKLLIQLFPETATVSQQALNLGQKLFFSHGALLMPWIWWNCSLCPAQDSNWVEVITLLWVRHEYSWLIPNSDHHKTPSRIEGSDTILNYSHVTDTLLENHAIGFKHLLKIKHDHTYWEQSGFPTYVFTLAVLQVYSATCGSPKLLLSKEERDDICAQIGEVLQMEIVRSFKGSARLEAIDMVLSLPQEACDRMIQSLDLKFDWALESLLLEIEISADPTQRQEERSIHQGRALSKLKFLTRFVGMQTISNEHPVKSSVVNLVNTLLTPLRCDHIIALAVTKFIVCICKSGKERWSLTHQQLQTVSAAMLEVMTAGRGLAIEPKRVQHGGGIQAGLVTAEFVVEHCAHFDYQMKYLLSIFGALREELADELWIHLQVPLPQTGPHISNEASNHGRGERGATSEEHTGILIAEALYALFNRFSKLQRRYVQTSPLTRELLNYLRPCRNQIFQKLVAVL